MVMRAGPIPTACPNCQSVVIAVEVWPTYNKNGKVIEWAAIPAESAMDHLRQCTNDPEAAAKAMWIPA
jgi:hypothetical protein